MIGTIYEMKKETVEDATGRDENMMNKTYEYVKKMVENTKKVDDRIHRIDENMMKKKNEYVKKMDINTKKIL